MTGCTLQRPQEERRQAGAGVEKGPETPGEGQERGRLRGTQAFLPPGMVLSAVTCHSTLMRNDRVKSRARPDGLTLDLDHMLFSHSYFHSFETLTRRPWLRREAGRRVDRGRGKPSPGLGFAKLASPRSVVREE